ALFRLNQGHLKFDQIEFYLKPHRKEFDAQTVVALTGNAQCSFRNCVCTLEPSADASSEARLSVVTLLDAKGVMPTPATDPRPTPEIMLRNCFVRGQGDLLWARACRGFDLDVDNALVV